MIYPGLWDVVLTEVMNSFSQGVWGPVFGHSDVVGDQVSSGAANAKS